MRRILLLTAAGVLLPAATLGAQTAHVGPDNLYPDAVLTPGEVFNDATAAVVCVDGYMRTVPEVPESVRVAVFASYGLPPDAANAALNRLIPSGLGGDNAPANLWPEAYGPPGVREKAEAESYLRDQVCAGQLALADAQSAIAADWYAVYLELTPPSMPSAPGAAPTPDPMMRPRTAPNTPPP